MKNLQNSSLEERIKIAKRNVTRKEKSVEKAEENLSVATNELYALKCERDYYYIQSLKGVPDWELIFAYKAGQTQIINEYRKNAFDSKGIEMHGSYSSDTMQHNLSIFFETNDKSEVNSYIPKIEFIFQHLKFKKNNIKCIMVRNMLDRDCIWELEYSGDSKLFSIVKTAYHRERERYSFTTLDAVLEKTQSMSNISFESKDLKLIGQNNQSEDAEA